MDLNILILAELVTKSGVGKYILELSDRLIQNGNRVIIATPYKNVEEYNPNIKWNILKPLKLTNVFSIIKSINSICKSEKIDVIHANHRSIAAMLRFCNIKRHIPVVLTYHTSIYPKNKLKDFFTYNGDACIAVSSEVRELLLSKNVPLEKIHLILNGVDESKLVSITRQDKKAKQCELGFYGKKCIVMHGRIDHVKGIDLLVDAASKLETNELKNIMFIVSGEKKGSYYEELIDRIHQLNLDNCFYFTGWILSSELFSIADMCIAPSRREGFPLSVIEAMLMGVPVCRTRTGGFLDMENYVFAIENESSDDIVRVIRDYLSNSEKYEVLAREAMVFAQNKCTISIMANTTQGLYQKLINEEGKK